MEEAIKLHGQGGSNWMKLFLAMAYQKQNRPEQARTLLTQAQLAPNAGWEERLIYHRLRQEADGLLPADQKPQS